jgi:signal transduction histidine kinase
VRIDRARFHDTLFAVALAAVSVWLFLSSDAALLEPAGGQAADGIRGADTFGAVLVVLACAPVAVRRRWPLATLCAGLLPETLLTGLGYGSGVAAAPVLVLLYSVASLRGLAVALCALLLSFLAYAFAGTLSPVTGANWSEHLVAFIVLLAVWGAGRSLRLRRAYLEELKDRAARLERAYAADTRAARAEERSRIARELHDVVAHHVSVMTVQAAAARRVLAADPDMAREALSAIEHRRPGRAGAAAGDRRPAGAGGADAGGGAAHAAVDRG